jgi:hypothetical protein
MRLKQKLGAGFFYLFFIQDYCAFVLLKAIRDKIMFVLPNESKQTNKYPEMHMKKKKAKKNERELITNQREKKQNEDE